jgi:sn-glycerol 3-phosphate transport system ATP-binding protein
MAAVTLTDVRKVYPGGVEAVRGVSLAIADGSFTVLLGPSGCGKSTLLRMIAGLETISGGQIGIGGRVVNDIEPADRDIAMVFQNYALYPHMSVYDNMAYGLRNRKVPPDIIKARVADAARLLEIEPYLKRKPRALSGGQRQRVAMGRAIVREPQAFLFDEPLSNLDAKLRVAMRLEIRRLHNRLRATSIFVTHDQVEAMTLADQVVVMNAGRIEQIGTPTAVYQRPETTFVASFIGAPAMNLMRGRVTEPGVVEVMGATGRAGRLTFRPLAFSCAVGDAVRVGVRPEDLREAPADAPEGGTMITMTREFTEELGATRLIHGLVADGTGGGTPLVWSVASATPVTAATLLTLTADADAIHLFQPDSGASLRRPFEPVLPTRPRNHLPTSTVSLG